MIGRIILKCVAFLSTVGAAVTVQAENADPSSLLHAAKTIGGFSSSEILGMVSIVSVTGLILLYRDSRKDNKELRELIKENTQAQQKTADALEHQVGILVETKDAILKCKK